MKHFANLNFRSLLLFVFSLLLFQTGIAQTLTSNTFTGVSACPTNGNSFSAVTNATVTALSRNTISCATAANVFNSSTLNNTASRNDNSYIEFSITANSGYSLNLTSLSFFRQGSNTAPNSLIVSYSTDANAANFNSTRVDMATSTTASSGTVLTWTFPSAITTANGGKVTFRFYPFGTVSINGGTAATTGTFRLDDVTLNGSVVLNGLAVNPTSLTAFNYTENNGPSPAQSYTLTGNLLTPDAGNITATAPANFEISTTSATAGFADTQTIAYTGGAFTGTTIYARLKAGLTENTYSGNITHSGGGTTNPPSVALSGSVTTVPPPVVTTTGTLTAFSTFVGNPATSQSYTVSGTNLVSDITITAPSGFEIKTGTGAYGSSLILPQSSGNVATTTIDVRVINTTAGTFSGNITHTTTNLSPSPTVAVSGTVVAACATPTNISVVRASIPEQASYTGVSPNSPATVAGRVTAIFGPNKFYIQDATGGLAIFSSANGGVVTANSIALGDSIRVTGPTARFNGEAEFNGVTCVNKVAGNGAISTPPAIIFDANNPPSGVNLPTFLANNEGRLVKIVSNNINVTGTFGSGNYSITACNSQGEAEIRIDATATTIPLQPIPTVTQDITGVIGHYINASATVKYPSVISKNNL